MTWWKWIGVVIATSVVVIAALTVYSHRHWKGLTNQLVTRLDAARAPLQPDRFDARELESLPLPVQRFFRAALTDGMPLVAAVSVQHKGSFNMGEKSDEWKPFRSTQRVVTKRPGFVWDGRVSMLPGLSVHVHDAYVAGEGVLHPAIAGLVTLIDLHGGGDIARGELMRYFAEAAWYPTALLPSQGVHWEAIDEYSARATFADGSLSLAMTFRFGTDGLIESVRTEARGRTVGGKIIPTPWEGRWMDYQVKDGMRVPLSGEVAWLLTEGRKPYWRGTITALRYEFSK